MIYYLISIVSSISSLFPTFLINHHFTFIIHFILSSVIVISSAIMFIMIPTIPPILNIIMPLNESRDREFIYPTYFFIDEEKYYYPILTYMAIVILIVSSVYLACDTNLVQIVHHGCALLAISGWVIYILTAHLSSLRTRLFIYFLLFYH